MNINQAKAILLNELEEGSKIVSTGRYKDYYVFKVVRPNNQLVVGNKKMELDPYWFVNANNGEIEQYIQFFKPEIFDQITWLNGEMKHHGIKGQKWGVRRYQNPDGSLTPAGEERYGVGNSKSESKSKFHLTDKQKKILIAGTVAVGTALAIYGAHKIGMHYANKLSTNPKLIDYVNAEGDLSKLFKKKDTFTPGSFEEAKKDLKAVNNGPLGFIGLKGRQTNCPNCAMAYELRRRGLDVKAAQLDGGRTTAEIEAAIGKRFTTLSDYSGFTYEHDFYTDLLSQPKGSRGFVIYNGHINNYEVFSDGLRIMESQAGFSHKADSFILSTMEPVGFMRTDNANPASLALDYISNNDKSQLLRETLNKNATATISSIAGYTTYKKLSKEKPKEKTSKTVKVKSK